MKHVNSREIRIFRASSFLSRAQGNAADDYYSTTKKAIGSYWDSVNNKIVGSGLTKPEIDLLLPELVEVTPAHPEFLKKVNTFFHEMNTVIPFNTGLTLEIGLTVSNDKPVSQTNWPLNVMDYIKYRHAIKHPDVAPTKEVSDGDSRKQFYVFDKAAANELIRKDNEAKDTAMQIYLQLKEEPRKRDMFLTLLGVKVQSLLEGEKDAEFRKQAERNYKKFMAIHEQGDVDERYWIESMIATGLMKTMGGKYLIAETSTVIGSSIEECIFFFKQDENSEQVAFLKSALAEKLEGVKS